jgi:hypothetical protein
MPRADKAGALVAGAEAPAAEVPVLPDGARVRVLRQFSAGGEIHEVGKIMMVPEAFARMLIHALKAESAPEPLEGESQ